MYFKNAIFYRLKSGASITVEQLSRRAFQPCGALDPQMSGWVSPRQDADLVLSLGDWSIISLQTETKILPASVIRQHAEDRAEAIEREQGFKVGRKQMRELKDEITRELLPVAFGKRSRTYAAFNEASGLLVIDASSRSRAEDVLEVLRHSLDAFPVTMIRTEMSPTSFMADCLAASEAPGRLTLDDACELQSVTEEHSKIKYANYSLGDDDVKQHLAQGRLPKHVAMTFDDRVSFVLHDDGRLTKLGFLDVVQEQASADADDAAELFDAQITLGLMEIERLIATLVECMGGEMEDLVDKAEAPIWPEGDDPLYEQAVQIVTARNRASISLVQREFRIGYNRAARLIERMEADGYLSPMNSQGTREVVALV